MERNERKIRVGKVVSDKMDKTVVVAVEYKNTAQAVQKADYLDCKIQSPR